MALAPTTLYIPNGSPYHLTLVSTPPPSEGSRLHPLFLYFLTPLYVVCRIDCIRISEYIYFALSFILLSHLFHVEIFYGMNMESMWNPYGMNMESRWNPDAHSIWNTYGIHAFHERAQHIP
jgi:hypothetical protein